MMDNNINAHFFAYQNTDDTSDYKNTMLWNLCQDTWTFQANELKTEL